MKFDLNWQKFKWCAVTLIVFGQRARAVSMFEDMLNGTSNAMDSIASMFKKMLAQMATMAIAKPIMIPMIAAVGG